jgi:hypothetical protein
MINAQKIVGGSVAPANDNGVRLDAAESAFFAHQLRYISPKLYNVDYADLMARQLVPTIQGVPDWAPSFVFRGIEMFGTAKIGLGDMADDLPRADVAGQESTAYIKTVGGSIAYSREEVRMAMATGMGLPEFKMMALRRMIDEAVDGILATGDAATGLTGILQGTQTTDAFDKSGGGETWAEALPEEMVKDVANLTGDIVANTKGRFKRFRVVVPIAQYNQAANTNMGDGSGDTVLARILKNPYVESFNSWHKCVGAGSGPTDRMSCWPSDPSVVGALVTREFTLEQPQDRNLTSVVNATARCGGIVKFYPQAIGHMDGI